MWCGECMAQIIAAFELGNFATPARLRVSAPRAGNADFASPADKNLKLDLQRSVVHAQRYTAAVAGWPLAAGLEWTIEEFEGLPLPNAIEGPSLFGALCLASMKAVANCQAWSIDTHRRLIRATAIDRVAISTAFDRRSRRFAPVGQIELKLKALARLPPDVCALAIVAYGQKIDLPAELRHDLGGQYELVIVPEGRLLPLIRAIDPVDAFRRVCLMECGSVLNGG